MKYFLIIFASLFYLSSCTSESATSAGTPVKTSVDGAESPDISIEVKNMPPGEVFLIGTFTGQNYRVDSTGLDASGKLRFKRDTPLKPGMYFVVFENNANLQLLLDQDQTMNIKTDAADFSSTTIVEGNLDTKLLFESFQYESDHKAKMGVVSQQLKNTKEGTPEYESLKAQQTALMDQRKADLEKVFQQYPNSLYTSFKRAGQNPDIQDVRLPDGSVNTKYQIYLYRSQFWNNVDFSDQRLLYTPVISNKLKRYVEQLVPKNPDSINYAASYLVDKVLDYQEYFKYFANYITLAYEPGKSTLMDSEKVHVHMIQNYFTKERAFWTDSMTVHGLQQRAGEMAASLTGLKGPNVTSTDQNGQTRSIYDLKADYIIVYLFNPTCEHCMVETPLLVQLKQRVKSAIDVYAIAIDTNDQEWKDYIQKNNMTSFTNVHDPTNRSIYARYFVDVTPEIYVLNKDRILIAKNLKVSQIEEVIQRDREKQ